MTDPHTTLRRIIAQLSDEALDLLEDLTRQHLAGRKTTSPEWDARMERLPRDQVALLMHAVAAAAAARNAPRH